MHVSLDSALGRQRRLNSVGESVLQIAPNAAAAYSLRSLTGGDPTVVRVRRGSDNHEQDFTASEVSAGALTSFVNAQVVAPLDIKALEADGRTGDFLIAKAAYSLRSLGTRQATLAATGDTVARADGKFVAQVRRASDDALKSFTATEVTDGTLRNFCLNDDADIISFADAGLAGSPAADKRMYFDGVNDSVSLGSNVVLAGDFEIESKLLLQSYDIVGFSFPCLVGNGSTNRLFFSSGGTTLIFDGTNTAFGGVILPLNTLTTVKLKRTGTTVELFFDGVSKGTTTNSASFTIAFLGSRETTAGLINGFIYDLSITSEGTLIHSYKGYGNTSADWEDQTGSNDGTVAGSPALFTGQGFDGFVKTWYDQSVTNEAGDTATGNHATQATAASQPKIVSAGSLVANGIDFDGSDDRLTIPNDLIASINSASSFLVAKSATGIGSRIALALSHSTSNFRFYAGALLSFKLYFGYQNTALKIELSAADTNKHLFTSIAGSSNTEAFLDGTSKGTVSSVDGKSTLSSGGIGSINTGNFWSGTIQEVIVYNTDQSANRTAIEANIGEVYSIDLPSGVDPGFDQVDGFVETWYDQSGNGRDAVQATAGSQPKIVDGGSYLGKVDFTSSGIALGFSSIAFGTTYSFFLVAPELSVDNFKIVSGGSAPRIKYIFGSPDRIEVVDGSFIKPKFRTDDTFTESDNLTCIINASTTTSVFFNGNASATNTFTLPNSSTYNTLGGDSVGGVFEVILYDTNQSDNRVALETNINNQYDLF